MKYKCVIFDCDGVLVDSEAISCKVLLEMAKDLGLNLNWDDTIEEFSGKSLGSIVEYIEARIEGKVPSNFETEFRKKTFEAFKQDLKPIAGVSDLVNALNVPFCVASSGPREKIKLNLTLINLINKFSEHQIFSSYDIGCWKPDPGIYLHAANKMGYKPEDCAVIEDSIYGVEASISGGFDTFAYTRGPKKETFVKMGATTFSNMKSLERLLKV